MKSKIILLFIAFLSTISIAQTKVGTIDSEYIVGLMPEVKVVVERAQEYGKRLDSSFTIKLQEYKVKLKDYQDNEKTFSDLIKKTKIEELTNLEQDIKRYQDNGNKLMQLKENELMRPLYKKLNDAISAVSKANRYTQVLTITGNQFAYIDERFDITKLVMSKLGVKEKVQK